MNNLKGLIYPGLLLSLSLSTISCGSSSSSSPGAVADNKNIVATGVMSKGSVVVNGVRFDDTAAAVTIDDKPKAVADLQDGMNVKVRGRLNDDGVTGVADKVKADDELEGPVTSVTVDPVAGGKLVVLGHTVFVDDLTVFANVAGLAGIVAGDIVEVHGFVDANSQIRASRVEKKAPEGAEVNVKGIVSGLNTAAGTFNIGNTVVTFVPPVTGLANGVRVEVEGAATGPTTMTAAKIEFEDIEDADFDADENENAEVEGFISGFTSHPGIFTVNGKTVQTTASTIFRNGSAIDLGENIKVEAEGRMAGGVLIATKIEFKRVRVLIQSVATGVAAGQVTFFGSPGKVVYVNEMTRLDNINSLADIAVNTDRVEIRGFVNKAGQIIAERIKEIGGNNDDIIQAQVETENESARTVTLLGITINLSGGNVTFQNVNDNAITANDFFAAVVPGNPGTLVKAKGTFSVGTGILTGREAELEN